MPLIKKDAWIGKNWDENILILLWKIRFRFWESREKIEQFYQRLIGVMIFNLNDSFEWINSSWLIIIYV
jgi:hypothetical protein